MAINTYPNGSASGGGGGMPIDSMLPLRRVDPVVVLNDGSTWLRSGYLEDDPSVYPDADPGTPFDLTYPVAAGSIYLSSYGNIDSLRFKPDGTRMFFIDSDSGIVYQFDLSTPWDVTTGTLVAGTVDFSTDKVSSIAFSSDGTKLFRVTSVTSYDRVYQYPLSTAWDLSTVGTTTGNKYINDDEYLNKVQFKPDGTKMYLLGTGNKKIFQYTLSTAWNVTTASLVSATEAYSSSPYDFVLNDDGTKCFLVWTGNSVRQYPLSTAWDITTISSSSEAFFTTNGSNDTSWSIDGNVLYAVSSNDFIYQYKVAGFLGIKQSIDTDTGFPIYVRVA